MSRSLQVLAFAGLCAFSLAAASQPAAAEVQIGVFGGANSNFSSDAKLSGAPNTVGGGTVNDSRHLEWDGASFDMPPYWGVRATYWLNRGAGWGFGIEYQHTKAIAELNFATDPIYQHLEFTDGNNLVFFDALYRFQPWMNGKVVPYVGAGIGVSIPHTEVILANGVGGDKTWEYQCCGFAAQVLAGLEYNLNEKWSLFIEGKLSYSHIDAPLHGGGSFETDLWSPQLAIGLNYRF